MNCDYLLVYRGGLGQDEEIAFHAPTPEEAEEQGRKLVVQKQRELVEEHPFAPIIVRAVLYRGFREFDGADFITIVKSSARAVANSTG